MFINPNNNTMTSQLKVNTSQNFCFTSVAVQSYFFFQAYIKIHKKMLHLFLTATNEVGQESNEKLHFAENVLVPRFYSNCET